MSKWAEFRKLGVTELVRDVYRRAKGLKPKVQVTAAVFNTPWNPPRRSTRSGRAGSARRRIDYVIPMAYTDDTGRAVPPDRPVEEDRSVSCSGSSRACPSTRTTAGKAVTRNLDLIRRQHALCRQQGAHGNLYFSLQYLSDPLIDVLRTEFYPTEAPVYTPPSR